MKRVLIISPYFPPSNAADMHRVRMSLPYFEHFGWHAEVVCVDERFSDVIKDPLLLESVPQSTIIHKVAALPKKLTSKIGLGSIALRSLWYYKKKVNQLLKTQCFDLIYFSTTQFPVCVLGAYWKKRFGIPYVIDMQDPWHSEYYKGKPKHERPAKHWFSYRLNKYLEPVAMNKVDGLISVSEKYIIYLKERYPSVKNVPNSTITFGAFKPDLLIADAHSKEFKPMLSNDHINVVYIGRGGNDMHPAMDILFRAVQKGVSVNSLLFKKLKFYFIGTSYAAAGKGTPTIQPLAKAYGVESLVTEITDRISYYHTLATLHQADALLISGSDDPAYTASKIYPYLLMLKPLLAIFHKQSSAINIINECTEGAVVATFPDYQNKMEDVLYQALLNLAQHSLNPIQLTSSFGKYSAENLTLKQADLFNQVINEN